MVPLPPRQSLQYSLDIAERGTNLKHLPHYAPSLVSNPAMIPHCPSQAPPAHFTAPHDLVLIRTSPRHVQSISFTSWKTVGSALPQGLCTGCLLCLALLLCMNGCLLLALLAFSKTTFSITTTGEASCLRHPHSPH